MGEIPGLVRSPARNSKDLRFALLDACASTGGAVSGLSAPMSGVAGSEDLVGAPSGDIGGLEGRDLVAEVVEDLVQVPFRPDHGRGPEPTATLLPDRRVGARCD